MRDEEEFHGVLVGEATDLLHTLAILGVHQQDYKIYTTGDSLAKAMKGLPLSGADTSRTRVACFYARNGCFPALKKLFNIEL